MLPKRKNKGKRFYFLFLLVISGWIGWFAWNVRSLTTQEQEISFTPGMGAGEIADTLQQKGIVRSARAFTLYAYLTGTRNRLQAGNFTIPARADTAEVIALLTAGEQVKENTVRIIEGWTIEEIDAYLAKENIFEKGAFKVAAGETRKSCRLSVNSCQAVAHLPQKLDTLEGYLFPNTYRLYEDATPESLIEKMLIQLSMEIQDEKFRNALRDSRHSLHEVLTMASIIEAEVPHAEDRALVSGLLWKRIDAGMPLQVDATINYITGKQERSASLSDLKFNSPYNTYLYPDLPPGPIGSPGMGALMAAVQPKDSPYWFYLSSKDGTTIFSKTFEEHKAAKAKYLK